MSAIGYQKNFYLNMTLNLRNTGQKLILLKKYSLRFMSMFFHIKMRH
jgi:hypothetical protein